LGLYTIGQFSRIVGEPRPEDAVQEARPIIDRAKLVLGELQFTVVVKIGRAGVQNVFKLPRQFTLGVFQLLVGNLNEGKGSAGQLLTNDSIYSNLNNSLESLNELLKDMKENPKRYVHFSIFGKKNIPEN